VAARAEIDMRAPTLTASVDLAGRMLLASLFILDGWAKVGAYALAERYMAAFGVPAALLPLVIAVEIGGGLMILLGLQTRWAAAALAVFCMAAAVIFHTNFADRNQVIHFQKDLALAGAFLVVCARGAGHWSLDCLVRGSRPMSG